MHFENEFISGREKHNNNISIGQTKMIMQATVVASIKYLSVNMRKRSKSLYYSENRIMKGGALYIPSLDDIKHRLTIAKVE